MKGFVLWFISNPESAPIDGGRRGWSASSALHCLQGPEEHGPSDSTQKRVHVDTDSDYQLHTGVTQHDTQVWMELKGCQLKALRPFLVSEDENAQAPTARNKM